MISLPSNSAPTAEPLFHPPTLLARLRYAKLVSAACDLTHDFLLQALSATCGHGPATRHLVIVAALNPTEGVLGPRGTLAWSTVVERLHQVCKLEAA
jgi:hypothetical protein